MSQKRQQDDGRPRSDANASTSDDKRRKVPSLRNVVLEVMKLRTVQNFMEPVLEPLIRRVVKEEVDLALRKYLTSMKWNLGKEIQIPESRCLLLQFQSTLSLPVFTGTRIEGEDCTSLRVALIDAVTLQVVSSGPEATAKVEIVVLEGDFDGDEGDSWTREEFNSNIVREREGKKPLLTGDEYLNLKEGIGIVGEISFSDNSSWTRSRKFRLGARVVDSFDGISVREAKTESFIVRDHRGELYKKHHPPSLSDEVWRLEKIGKDGAFHRRLTREKINTVKDFLTLLFIDPNRLRNILGSGMSAKMWDVAVDHARTCVLDKRVFLHYHPGSQQKSGVVFNVVGQLMGLLSDFQYVSVDKLSEKEKADAPNMIINAFRNWEEVLSFDDDSSFMDDSLCLSNILYPSNSPMRGSPDDGGMILSSHKIGGGQHHSQLSPSSPDIMSSIYSLGGVNCLDDFGLHSIDSMDVRFDEALSFPGQVSNAMICDTDSMAQAFCDDEQRQYFISDPSLQNVGLESPNNLHTSVSGFMFPCSGAVVAMDKAQRSWSIISIVLRWFSMSRRIVARKGNRDMHICC